MASKGRKAQVAAAQKAAATPSAGPVRVIPPFTPLNDENGATFRELDYYRVLGPTTRDEAIAWNGDVSRLIGLVCRPDSDATMYVRNLLKTLPSVVTFLPTDPEQDWKGATEWFATTKAPRFDNGRDLDPDYLAQGGTPLMALLNLVALQTKRQRWAWDQRSAPPRFLLWDMVHTATPVYKSLYPSG